MEEEKQTFLGNLKSCLGYVFGTIIIIIAVNFFINKEKSEWMGMFYSTDAEQSEREFKKGFKTIDDCREWAKKQAESRDMEDGEWDYDCGIGCSISSTNDFDPDTTTYDCSELRK